MDKANDKEIAELLAAGGVVVDQSARPIPLAARDSTPGGPLPPDPAQPAKPAEDPIARRIREAARTGTLGYKAGNSITFDFATPGEMFLYFNEDLEPHEWQLEELHRVGGYLNLENPETHQPVVPTKENPYLYNLVAANGSGKDTYFISPTTLWFISAKIRSRVIITSASQDQLKLQTFNYLKSYAERVNRKLGYDVYDIKEFLIYNELTGSEIVGRVTNDAGRAEGFHPFESPKNCEMMVVVNEAKSIDDDTYAGFSRFTGYNYWLNVSSPGTKSGTFYRTCEQANNKVCQLGAQFKRHITAFECPNIPRTHIDQVKLLHGQNSLVYITSILAQFYSSDIDVVIPDELFNYPPPEHHTYDLHPVAGLDLAFSVDGDPTRWSLWHGNKELEHDFIQTNNADRLHEWILAKINNARARYKLEPWHVYADGGGLGAPIISRIQSAGYNVVTRRNESAPFDKNYYLNLGAEMYFRVKRLIQERVLIIPSDPLARKQLSERKAIMLEGQQKSKLEPKRDAKRRLGYSPDRADSIVLALSGYPMNVLLSPPPARRALNRLTPEQFRAFADTFPFDRHVPGEEKRKAIYGLNHELITRYAQR